MVWVAGDLVVLSDCLCLGVILVGGGGAIELVSEKLVVFGCWIIRAGEAIPFVLEILVFL